MVVWDQLAKDMKLCVVIYRENKAGRKVWFTRLIELLKNDMSRRDISMLHDRLYDLGIINTGYEMAEGKSTYRFTLGWEAEGYVKNIVENLPEKDLEVIPAGAN